MGRGGEPDADPREGKTVSEVVIVENLKKYFAARTEMAALLSGRPSGVIRAVDGVSFDMGHGEILGLVGESGSGKSTIARVIARLEEPDSGEIWVDGQRISDLKGSGLKRFYRQVQMIFQDPYESLNPRFRVYDTVVEPLKVQKIVPRHRRGDLVIQALQRAGLKRVEEYLPKFPHQLSGGERQRLSIARALVVEPKVLIADEPVSMLDVSIKAGILNLLKQLSRVYGVTLLYISHDLSTVKYLCDRVVIMYLGKFVEMGRAEDVIDQPRHPYARALQAAIPIPDPSHRRPRAAVGDIREGRSLPLEGCRYRKECPNAMDACRAIEPAMRPVGEDHLVACHLYD